jgi:epsilon-lactone hydrolase
MQVRTAVIASIACLAGGISSAAPTGAEAPANATQSATDSTTVSAEGAVTVPSLTIPPSDYWSPEFKATYAKVAASVVAHRDYRQPVPTAPQSEWQKFDAACAQYSAATLAWQRQNYPVEVVETHLGGVHVAVVTPKAGVSTANHQRVLIELHGGSCGGLDGLTEAIPVAHFGKIKVVTVDYRAAPRNQYPASIEDVVAVYEDLLKQYKPGSIGLFGTSGGGMLATQTLSWLQSKDRPRPGAVGVFWSGITNSPYPFGKFGDSLLWELGGVPRGDHTVYNRLITQLSGYMDGVAANDPVGYPGSSEGVMAKFPPTLFVTGTRALDMSAAITSHARLLKLGIDSSLYVMEGGWHAASYGSRGSPEEVDVNTYIGRWFDAHLAR